MKLTLYTLLTGRQNGYNVAVQEVKGALSTIWSVMFGRYAESKFDVMEYGLQDIKCLFELIKRGELNKNKVKACEGVLEGFGISALSEILAFLYPHEYGIYNTTSQEALKHFVTDIGTTYNRFIVKLKEFREAFKEVLKEVFDKKGEELGVSDDPEIIKFVRRCDLVDVDFFLWWVLKRHGIQ